MNKKELIEELTNIGGCDAEDEWSKGYDSGVSSALELANQLDEPEIPVIPQFVADWIELAKDIGITLVGVMDFDTITFYKTYPKVEFQNLKEYMAYGGTQKIVARAWLDGYTIKKEKLYFVKEPITGQFLIKDNRQSNGVKWTDGFEKEPSYYTEQEIKAIDERYWAFAEEVPDV